MWYNVYMILLHTYIGEYRMNKVLTSFRLTKVVIAILGVLADKQQLNKTDIVTLAIMEYANRNLTEQELLDVKKTGN